MGGGTYMFSAASPTCASSPIRDVYPASAGSEQPVLDQYCLSAGSDEPVLYVFSHTDQNQNIRPQTDD